MIGLVLYLLLITGCGVAAGPSSLGAKLAKASDQLEVASLAPDQVHKFFTFCLETRDLVHEYLESRDQRDFATDILNTMFQSAEQLGLEPYTLERASAESLAAKIRDSDNKLADLEVIAKVQPPSEEKFAYLTLFGVIDQTKNKASRETLNKLDKYRELLGATNMHKHLNEACKVVNQLEFALSSALTDYLTKVKVVTVNKGLSGLRCATSQKVLHLNGICRFAMQAPTTKRGLTYDPVGARAL